MSQSRVSGYTQGTAASCSCCELSFAQPLNQVRKVCVFSRVVSCVAVPGKGMQLQAFWYESILIGSCWCGAWVLRDDVESWSKL
jgi:hypothetical protein